MKFLTILLIVAVAAHTEAKKKCFPVKPDVPTPTDGPSKKCPKPNEEYNRCGPADGCVKTCDKPLGGPCPKICVSGCFCKDGYVRNAEGKCILLKHCPAKPPKCTKPNEEYTDCGPAAGCVKTCDNQNGSGICPMVCVAGCFCKDGYVRNAEGKCVLIKHCPAKPPKCTKPNEEYTDCGPAVGCVKTCEKPQGGACTKNCVAGCFCEKGYLRNAQGKCVLPKECPATPFKCNKPHEVVNNCFNACTQRICNEPPRPCPPGAPCVVGCSCATGYIRTKEGNCIRNEDCKPPNTCPKPNQEIRCTGPCDNTCENPKKETMCKAPCREGCGCKKNFVKDSNGNCVKLSDCPKPIPTCGKNEKPSNCSRFCFEKRCEGFFRPQPVCRPGPCNTPTCICKDGFYRDENDKCVTAAQCKADGCKKPHTEYSECTGPCDATCENPNLPLVCKMACGPGCKCKDGYVKDEDGDCVKLNNCPKEPTPKCGVNEELNKCSTICGEATCETRVTRHCGAGKCKPKCHCKPGYLRHPNGSCVLKERCPIIDPPRPKK